MKAQELRELYKTGKRDFSNENLQGENFTYDDLSDADFRGANLQNVNFSSAKLHRVKFNEGILTYVDLSRAELIEVDLSGADLQGAILSETKLKAVVDAKTQFPRNFQAQVQLGKPDIVSDPGLAQTVQRLKQENDDLQKQLKQERQLSQSTISQLQQNLCIALANNEDLLKTSEKARNKFQEKIIKLNEKYNQLQQKLDETLQNAENQRLSDKGKITYYSTEYTRLKQALKICEATEKELQEQVVKLQEQVEDFIGRQRPIPVSLTSPELSKLIKYLKNSQWEKADKETNAILLKKSGQFRKYEIHRNKDSLKLDSIQNFSVETLQIIDQLWLQYSSGRFGFSVQAKIWREYGSTDASDVFKKVGSQLGWWKDNRWIWYDKLQFHSNAPKGHFPARVYDYWNGEGVVFHSAWVSLLGSSER
jgi:GUN4-like/Pentapeptide repeats (9 copies)